MARTPAAQDLRALDRAAWISAALETLAAEGLDGVRVERLAQALGITKGSFYHHFKDRADLHAAMLAQWRTTMVVEIMRDLEQITDPLQRFGQVMRLPTLDRRADLEVELAVRLWARRDPDAEAVLHEVDALRIDFVARMLVDCGAPAETARARAILVFAYLRAATGLTDAATLEQCEQILLGR